MLFTLEALQAKHGDSLLLHYGEADDPRLIVIDGGPSGVYRKSLRPRLSQIKDSRSPDEALEIRLAMVSHIDDDHIRGMLDWMRELADLDEDGRQIPYDIAAMWHNSFDDIVGEARAAGFAATMETVAPASVDGPIPPRLGLDRPPAVVLASVGQGRQLRGYAKKLGLAVNTPFPDLVSARTPATSTVDIGNELTFRVLGPSQERIDRFHEDWDKQLRKLGVAVEAVPEAVVAAYTDNSVYNLASIVVLAQADGASMLLTGDARGDDVLAGLEAAGLMHNGAIHVDILKLPHHGSDRNVDVDFFERITADRYVVSGDGKFGNPEIETLRMISNARGKDDFTIFLTNREERLRDFFAADQDRPGKKYGVEYRDEDALSIPIDLREELRD